MTMSPNGAPAHGVSMLRNASGLKPKRPLHERLQDLSAGFGPFARKVMSLSALTAVGQGSFVVALPLLSRLYTPTDFGVFTIYLSIVNIGGPLIGLKFESALYAARTNEEARTTLALSILTVILMGAAATGGLYLCAEAWPAAFNPVVRLTLAFLPFGLVLAGMWSVSSAWAIRSEAISTLAVARLLQPASMTVMQLAAAFVLPASGVVLIVAHLLSHVAYSVFVFSKTLVRSDLSSLFPTKWFDVLRHARAQRAFPLYALPAHMSLLAVSNLPPLLLMLFYGAGIAGECGVAYRLVAAPLAIASLPMGAILTSVVSRRPPSVVVVRLARKVFLANLCLVSVPILLLAVAAPAIAPAVFGDGWARTGEIIAAFALLGAAQSLAAPFTEITSIFRSQALRFFIEIVPATLVITSIFVGGLSEWGPLNTIWLMSIAGAGSTLLGLSLLWRRLPAMIEADAHDHAPAGPQRPKE
jgi:O-antigen/teichoic acid export membrane protein